jgi:hypothetical protein
MFAGKHINPNKLDVRTLGSHESGDQTVTAAYVEHANSPGRKLREPVRQDSHSATEYQFLVQKADGSGVGWGHCECAVCVCRLRVRTV